MLIVFGIMIAISSTLSMFFLDKITQWQNVFTIVALLISFIAGFFVIFKFYKESQGKCFVVWSLTCVAGIVLFFILLLLLIIIIALIF